jgi:hypothetical protein
MHEEDKLIVSDSGPEEQLFEVKSLREAFGTIPDSRRAQGRIYPLAAFLAFVTTALLCGQRGLRGIREWGLLLGKKQLRRIGLKRVPSQGAFSTILSNVDADACEAAISRWASAHLNEGRPRGTLAIDGKTLRGTASPDTPAIHVLSVFETSLGCVLGQVPVPPTTNEHKAALELLDKVDLEGQLVTGDAMFTQREVCERIRKRHGDYLFMVKDNQPMLRRDCAAAFEPPSSPFHPARCETP